MNNRLKVCARAILFLACMLISISGGLAQSSSKPLFDKPLFPQPLFSDDFGTSLDSDITRMQSQIRMSSSSTASTMAVADSSVDEEMRRQMRECARYLLRYGLRNNGRFPGYGNDEMFSVQTQLNDLVPNNPYEYSQHPTGWGASWSDAPSTQQLNRIRLSMDLSLTGDVIDNWAGTPPANWQAPPGTITCSGNGQGLFMVWGAGKDGKPIRNPANGRIFIITGNTADVTGST